MKEFLKFVRWPSKEDGAALVGTGLALIVLAVAIALFAPSEDLP